MKRWGLIFTFFLFLLSGCSGHDVNGQNKISYDYPPPVDGLSWGMSETEVMDHFRLTEQEITWQEYEGANLFGDKNDGTYRFFVLNDPLEFLEEDVSATFIFYQEIGLEEILLTFHDCSEQNIEVNVPLKLQEKYESSWGTDVLQLEDAHKKNLKEYLLANGMPKDAVEWMFEEKDYSRHPLVSYEMDTNPNSQTYGTVAFHGYLAAMLEHALEPD